MVSSQNILRNYALKLGMILYFGNTTINVVMVVIWCVLMEVQGSKMEEKASME